MDNKWMVVFWKLHLFIIITNQ